MNGVWKPQSFKALEISKKRNLAWMEALKEDEASWRVNSLSVTEAHQIGNNAWNKILTWIFLVFKLQNFEISDGNYHPIIIGENKACDLEKLIKI